MNSADTLNLIMSIQRWLKDDRCVGVRQVDTDASGLLREQHDSCLRVVPESVEQLAPPLCRAGSTIQPNESNLQNDGDQVPAFVTFHMKFLGYDEVSIS